MLNRVRKRHIVIHRHIHNRGRVADERAYVDFGQFVARRSCVIVCVLNMAVTDKHIFQAVVGKACDNLFSVSDACSAAGDKRIDVRNKEVVLHSYHQASVIFRLF